jgi:hypothetical protein
MAIKLYIVPIWTGTGYTLQVRLTDIRQSADLDVTSYTQIEQVTGGPFNGTAFGRQQHLKLTLDLDQSNPNQYPGQIHVQQVKIALNPMGSNSLDPFVIDYGGDGFTYLGADRYAQAEIGEDRRFRIDINQSNVLDWLSYLYWAADPAFDNSISDRAPTPTHFRLENGSTGVIGTYSVDDWDKELSLGRDRDWDQNAPLTFVWLQVLNGTEFVLAVTPLAIRYNYAPDGDG